jgi:uncharacterized protein YecE (DUF72 family)
VAAKPLSLDERRQRRALRREKQRRENVLRAAKMHAFRIRKDRPKPESAGSPERTSYVGCSGWFYWKWKGVFYPADLQTNEWFNFYAKRFETVEINASFYSWPTVANVNVWRRQAGKKGVVYTVKVSELITHIKRFKGTKTLVRDFGTIADILGEHMGCFLFQLPPSYHFTPGRLRSIIDQLEPSRRNVVEFRHVSWWNETVYAAFREHGLIFCSCSGPKLPDELVRTSEDVYLRLHGTQRWYRHDYTKIELAKWAERLKASGARRLWVYFNNDNEGFAPKNARVMRRLLAASGD